MLSHGPLDTPPLRVVKTARTLLGAGQSGTIQFSDGPPLGKLAPSGGSESHGVESVGATFLGFKVWASRGLRLLKCWQGHAGIKRGHGARQAFKRHVKTLCIEYLRH